MSAFKDIYDVLKDLKEEAKRLKSQEMISLSLDVQEKLFEWKEEIETINEENKALKKRIEEIEHPVVEENNIKYTQNGFFTLNSEGNKYPYCSACWRIDRMIIPLTKGIKMWYHYNCPHCKVEISIMDTRGNDLLQKGLKQ